ncbi:hypothetical protein IEQ34_007012 [Dendrobium chrysotoxum]|uniref:Uncharacterized protein n=1 Tax=Dendrobium chrysotoxum TaxID=161865 RepID=A0AAV7H6N5_DENCH|nr:hypothetical protein IEQ34_007012 [Dendrobium chrysotoxum]
MSSNGLSACLMFRSFPRIFGHSAPLKNTDLIIINASKLSGIRFTEPNSRTPFSNGTRTIV